MAATGCIELRGVEVHNLQSIDLDIPHNKLIVLCGLSGSGKSSLAIDTLYAEGQRRYIESFSAYTRQFLERLEKPEADRIDGIPPAIAVTSRGGGGSSRATVATATETYEYLRLLFAKIGRVTCDGCGREVRSDTPQSAANALAELAPGTRYLITFEVGAHDGLPFEQLAAALREDGFVRAIVGDRTIALDSPSQWPSARAEPGAFHVVVDRLTAGGDAVRLRDSLETAFEKGGGRCLAFVLEDPRTEPNQAESPVVGSCGDAQAEGSRQKRMNIDGRPWRILAFSSKLTCGTCGHEFAEPEPRLFSFNHPLGACPECEGFGNVIAVDMELVVPDSSKSIREGAIASWNSPAYSHERDELIALAPDYGIPIDVPFSTLTEPQLALIQHGVPEREFGGLDGFFAWLERRKYKMHIRVFLNRWRSSRPCPACKGARLRPEALAVRVGGFSIAAITAMKVADATAFFEALSLPDWQRDIGRMMLEQVENRLRYLEQVGLGYLTLDRSVRTLSDGEARRVAMTSALGSSLVNMLYVLDEPSIGLHPRDVSQLLDAVRQLRDRDNTVVVVEHEEAFIRAADQVVEIGPGAGERGGRIVFQGTPEEMIRDEESLTGDYLAGRRGIADDSRRRVPDHGWVRLAGARGNNLKDVTVEFPLGVLCLVTGVSGAGKSTLVQDILYPALCRRLRKDATKPLDYDDVFGDGQIDDIIMIDQSPIGRTPRSNPVTYLKAFDEIRNVFAETLDARTRGYSPGHFSFNVDGGRCPACGGDGYVRVDMQFLADVFMKCSECEGRRYRNEILEVTYRGRNIADVLDMTVREAFTFFRGRPKVQTRLKRLIDVGLDYVRLGQPANTLSGGEAQRLKLAAYMSSAKRGRCLFILDEPTTGLHFSDVVQLLDCFDALLAVGHSLIVVEHNLQIMKAADYIVDLGPGAAEDGGRIVVKGTPEMVANCPDSVTARYLAEVLTS